MRWSIGMAGVWVVLLVLSMAGCNSPYHADRGALAGGLGGAGVGALVGSAVGHTGAGAAIGAGVGTLAGAAVGSEMDRTEAENRALIEARLGRQMAGSVTVQDVMAMHQAGVAPEQIITHIRSHGMTTSLQAQDLILLQQQKVPANIVQAMQESPPRPMPTQPAMLGQPPVVVQEYPYYWGPSYYYRPMPCYPHYGPGMHWGVSVGR